MKTKSSRRDSRPSAPLSPAPSEASPQTAFERKARLVELVQKKAFILVSDVARDFQVSEMTIRRDLEQLDRDGLVVRTHGGARVRDTTTLTIVDPQEPAFNARLKANQAGKQRIAEAALSLLAGCRTVALDVGTTTHLLAQKLMHRPGTKLFTSSMRTAMLLKANGMEVSVPGGQITGDEMSISGPVAVAQFERLWFDIVFIGVSGVTASGYFDYSMEDTEMKKVYLRRSTKKVVLCDSTKFHRMSLVQVAELHEADVFLTDAPPPPEIAVALQRAKVEVVLAEGVPGMGKIQPQQRKDAR